MTYSRLVKKSHERKIFALILIFAVPTSMISKSHRAQKPATLEARSTPENREQLNSLLDEEWQYELRSSPEFSTAIGDNRYNDRLGDVSAEFFRADLAERGRFLARFEALDPSGLGQQERLSRELMIRELREQIEGAQFKPWEMPVDQRGGPHLDLPELITLTPFHTARDYENYLSRLRQIPRVFDQTVANMRRGIEDGLMPPRYLLEIVSAQAEDVANKAPEDSPFFRPLKVFPPRVSQNEQQQLRDEVLNVIGAQIIPAYKKFAAFVGDEYAPRGRVQPGIWALPDGEERYRYAVRRMTTSNQSPDEIHEIGLKELEQTEAEMLAVARQFGFNDLRSFNRHIKDDRSHYGASGEQLLGLYGKYVHDIEPELPKLFGHLPKAKLVAVPMEPWRSEAGVPADYSAGTPDGSRPGHINVNEWDPHDRLLLNVEAIAYHEGIPGHHLQISLAQERADLPAFRRHAGYTAFVEGWAFYAERLGKELGRYQDPYSEYGRLENEMWRDIRLVVDTGVHAKRWSRDQMIDYFYKYTAMDEPNIQTEVDRYIGWPGQALGYKLGQLEILRLRAEAQRKLGNRFDIRAFHDEVLGSGPLPLDVLDEQVRSWIREQAK